MFTKALIICTIAAVALAVKYPAGLHPAVCPNYPYCDVEVLARHTPQGIPIPEWELPYARQIPYARMVAAPLVAPVPVVTNVGGVQYPADVDPASCPNYPYCA